MAGQSTAPAAHTAPGASPPSLPPPQASAVRRAMADRPTIFGAPWCAHSEKARADLAPFGPLASSVAHPVTGMAAVVFRSQGGGGWSGGGRFLLRYPPPAGGRLRRFVNCEVEPAACDAAHVAVYPTTVLGPHHLAGWPLAGQGSPGPFLQQLGLAP